jgi:amidase
MDVRGEPLSPWLDMRGKHCDLKPLHHLYKAPHVQHEAEMSLLREIRERETECDRLDVVIICPVAPHPIPIHDAWVAMDWTIVWSLVGYPAGIV